MNGRLEGQVAIVTGAAGGIGRGVCLRLAAEGAQIVCTDLQTSVEAVWAEVQQLYPHNLGFAVIADVTSAQDVDGLVNTVRQRLGRLDIMFNNAGALQPMLSILETPDDIFDKNINVNLRGVFNGCRAAGRVMRDQRRGSIINTGSWYGKQGFANFGVYCASKAAVIRLTESLALELAPYGVRANSICPGNMATDMHWQAVRDEAKLRDIPFEEMDRRIKASIPLGQQGTPDDIAAAVVYLSSQDGAYVTGQALNVNGGVLFH
jgi:NAD(P)-dependent dehydrogenase (short-subunit alcohol dehydrogenase family)